MSEKSPSLEAEQCESLEAEFPMDTDPKTAELIIKSEESQAKSGRIIGFICVFLGAILLILDIAGIVNFNIQIGAFNSSLSNATPGVFLILIGFLVIWVTKLKIKVIKS